MIRGAIDAASSSVVSGWLFSTDLNLTGKIVLAFVDERCVGAGRIEVFRGDLKAAGLGDGFSGFHFDVVLAAGDTPEAIVVRLDHSDLALIQRGAIVRNNDGATRKRLELVASRTTALA